MNSFVRHSGQAQREPESRGSDERSLDSGVRRNDDVVPQPVKQK